MDQETTTLQPTRTAVPVIGITQRSGTSTCPLLQNAFPLSCYADKTLTLSAAEPERFSTWRYPTPEQVTETIRRHLDETLIGRIPTRTLEPDALFCTAQRIGKQQLNHQLQSAAKPTNTTKDK